MDLNEIKRGLRAEIKKMENEQYFTFQCNVRQMCKDVLAKLEEQESEIAELKSRIAPKKSDKPLQERLNEVCKKHGVSTLQDLDWAFCESEKRRTNDCFESAKAIALHKYKRCLGMVQEWRNYAAFCGMQSHCHNHRGFGKTAEIWTWKECHAWKCSKRYKELAEKFKPNNLTAL